MRTPAILSAAALAVAVLVWLPASPADAKRVDREKFTDTFTSDPYDCEGTPAQDSGVVHVTLMVNLRGSSPFPYFREGDHGRVVTTNLATGGTLTQVFSNNFTDHKITDNGDGTITIISHGAGGTRWYDQFGNFVLKDPGTVRFAIDIDYNGTPGDPSDDVEVPNSFRIVKHSTGHSDFSGRDFCEDLRTFTS